MSWRYLPALVADFSEADCSAGEPSAPSKSTPTVKRSSSRAKRTAASILSRSGITLELSTDARGVELWMSSLRASRASLSAPPESEREPTTNGTCGPTPSGSFAKWDRDTACWKTYQLSLFTGTLEPFSETWPRAGIARGGTVSRRRPLAPLTGETGCGLWPTPNVPNRGPETRESKAKRRSGDAYLQTAVKMFPTPTVGDSRNARNSTATRYRIPPTGVHVGDTLTDHVTKFPTPMARDWKSSNASPETMSKNARPLNETVTGGKSGQLNPTWVEWLMDWPLEWTALKPLATGRFREWLQQHGDCSARSDEDDDSGMS